MLTKTISQKHIPIRFFLSIYSTIKRHSSIHSASIDDIYNIPMKDITRPLPSILDENKVQSLIETIQSMKSNRIPPIDVLWYKAPHSRNNYFFSMGGCHRWEAYKRLNSSNIHVKLVRTTLDNLKIYFGSSLPNLE